MSELNLFCAPQSLVPLMLERQIRKSAMMPSIKRIMQSLSMLVEKFHVIITQQVIYKSVHLADP